MSEKRFVACDKWADSEGNIFKFVVIDTKILGDKQFILRCNHWNQAQDICNRLNDTLDELSEENEQLRKQIQNYEQLISNSYVGEEETLDGFVGKYVIWENELQKYRKKNKNEIIDNE